MTTRAIGHLRPPGGATRCIRRTRRARPARGTRPARRLGWTLTGLAVVLTATGCADDEIVIEDVDATLTHLVEGLHAFYGANIQHHWDHGVFVMAPPALAQDPRWLPDSVALEIRLSDDQQSWTAVATHVRVGPRVGCAHGWGDSLGVSTPGGVPFAYDGMVVCDDAFSGSDLFRGVAMPSRSATHPPPPNR